MKKTLTWLTWSRNNIFVWPCFKLISISLANWFCWRKAWVREDRCVSALLQVERYCKFQSIAQLRSNQGEDQTSTRWHFLKLIDLRLSRSIIENIAEYLPLAKNHRAKLVSWIWVFAEESGNLGPCTSFCIAGCLLNCWINPQGDELILMFQINLDSFQVGLDFYFFSFLPLSIIPLLKLSLSQCKLSVSLRISG